MIGYGEGVFYFNDVLKKWEDISNDLTLSKKGEDIAISGNKIFTDGFPIPFDNTSYIYSLNFDEIFTSSKEVSPNSHNIKIFPVSVVADNPKFMDSQLSPLSWLIFIPVPIVDIIILPL